MAISTSEELGKALKSETNTIIIEGDLAKKVIRIKATGAVAWGIAFAAIGVAVVGVLATPLSGGSSLAVSGLTATGAASILGASTTTSAIAIAVAAGGASSLNKLRKYKIIDKSDHKVTLVRS
ncbi:hypothetical protein [Marinomonas fungiae]|uniref:hypothetical protein n=1 Tax=Marinomonas fungiae TaxID=1137284 RepID=UPI003A8D6DA0